MLNLHFSLLYDSNNLKIIHRHKWNIGNEICEELEILISSFQFQEFETEKSFDIVQILVGGRTEEKSVNLATLSGKQELSNKLFVSASNFMIIKFSTDSSVERKGFRASWKTEPQTCGGILRATPQGQVLTSPGYPQNYPGGLECLYILQAQPGRIMSLEVRIFFFHSKFGLISLWIFKKRNFSSEFANDIK